MKTFTIDGDNAVTVFASSADAQRLAPEAERFSSADDLAKLTAEWPGSRLVAVWNGIPGVAPVKKFTDRKTAVRRIWEAVQHLKLPAPVEAKQKPARAAKPRSRKARETERGASKKDLILGLLKRENGATLEEITSATGWQAHSVRGFISAAVVKKLRFTVHSEKREGKRFYSIAG